MKTDSVPFYLACAFGLLGKDIKHSMRIPAGTLTLMIVLLLVNQIIALVTNRPMEPGPADDIMRAFLLFTSFAIGLAITTEEEEEDTSAFIHQLPLRPLQVIFSKFSAAMILFLSWCVVAGLVLIIGAKANVSDIVSGLSFTLYGGETVLSGVVLGASLIAIGAAVGSWFGHRGLPFAALMGFCMMVTIVLVTFYYHYIMMSADQPRTYLKYLYSMNVERFKYISTSIWAFLGIGIITWNIREYTRQAIPPDFSLDFLKKDQGIQELEEDEPLFSPTLFMSPSLNFRLIGLPAILFTVAACGLLYLVCLFFDLTNEGINNAAILVGLCVLSPLLGSYACYKGERDRPHFLIHQLPVSFERFQTRRLVLVSMATILGVSIIMITRYFVQATLGPNEDDTNMTITLLFCIGAAIGTAWMGYMFRLFLKSFLIAFLISMVATLPIVILYSRVILFSVDTIACIWATLVFVGLPFLMIKLLTSRTTLLESGDGVRMLVGIFVTFWMLIWIAFLITMNPVDLWIMLTS